jgi:hypothetical protein
MNTKLSPGCQIATYLAPREFVGEAMSIEFLRAMMEAAPTYPDAWTPGEGSDFAKMYMAA